ncbi:MAG: aldo/keto reductase [Pseudomonadota bacterium]|nr:aldo/keto reductase [Pseudomonadota bacterium]
MIDPVERRRIGETSLAVSRLGVGGGSSFARAGAKGPAIIDAAWDTGLRYFDTAPLYGGGESETRFGSALQQRPREQYVLSTKVGRKAAAEFDYSAAGVVDSLGQSLERLGLSRIDIAIIHDVDPDQHGQRFEQAFDEAMGHGYPALARLRDAGTLGAIGVGLKDWSVALRMARAARLDCIMLAGGYTLLQHGGLAELLPWCVDNAVSVLLAAPFNTGILATGAIDGARYYYQPAPAAILQKTRELESACAAHAVPLAAAALQFPLHHPAVVSVVAGHQSAGEVEENIALLRYPIPPALWSELKDRGLIPRHAPTP